MAEHGFSQRRACRLIEVNPKTVRRQVTADAPEVRRRLRALAGERSRFGYCRLGVALARKGLGMTHKHLLAVLREEWLAVLSRPGSNGATATRAPLTIPPRTTHNSPLSEPSNGPHTHHPTPP